MRRYGPAFDTLHETDQQ